MPPHVAFSLPAPPTTPEDQAIESSQKAQTGGPRPTTMMVAVVVLVVSPTRPPCPFSAALAYLTISNPPTSRNHTRFRLPVPAVTVCLAPRGACPGPGKEPNITTRSTADKDGDHCMGRESHTPAGTRLRRPGSRPGVWTNVPGWRSRHRPHEGMRHESRPGLAEQRTTPSGNLGMPQPSLH